MTRKGKRQIVCLTNQLPSVMKWLVLWMLITLRKLLSPLQTQRSRGLADKVADKLKRHG